jgi:hypothetical protein
MIIRKKNINRVKKKKESREILYYTTLATFLPAQPSTARVN